MKPPIDRRGSRLGFRAAAIVVAAIVLPLRATAVAPSAEDWTVGVVDSRFAAEVVRYGPDDQVTRIAAPKGESWLAVRLRLRPPSAAGELPPGGFTVTDPGGVAHPAVGIAGLDPEALAPTYLLFEDAADPRRLSFPSTRHTGPGWGYSYGADRQRSGVSFTDTDPVTKVPQWSFNLDRSGKIRVDYPTEAFFLFRTPATSRRFKLYLGGRPLASLEASPARAHPEREIEQACDAGKANECLRLAEIYMTGAGLPTDVSRAIQLYSKACDAGDGEGCSHLAGFHVGGRGVPEDEAKAVALFQKSCDAGYETACTQLAGRYLRGEGVPRDEARSAAILAKACAGGGSLACNNLGVAYAYGTGVTRDVGRAVELYRRACDAGLELGCTNLSKIHAVGAAAGDAPGAAEAQKKVCDLGDAWSCASLGYRYYSGRGVARHPATAARLLDSGCRGGEAWACGLLGELYWSGTGVERNARAAAEMYAKACDGNVRESCTNLGLMYLRGLGIDKNEPKGRALLYKACSAGYKPACQEIK